jgi:hypothetical protein
MGAFLHCVRIVSKDRTRWYADCCLQKVPGELGLRYSPAACVAAECRLLA